MGRLWGWRAGSGTLKRRQKKGGGEAVFSVRCLPGLNESTCFSGGWDMDWGDGRARRDTDLQQGLFQGSLHSRRLHLDCNQANPTSLSPPETHQLVLQPCCTTTFGALLPLTRPNSSSVGCVVLRLSSIHQGHDYALISFHE